MYEGRLPADWGESGRVMLGFGLGGHKLFSSFTSAMNALASGQQLVRGLCPLQRFHTTGCRLWLLANGIRLNCCIRDSP